MYERLAAEHHLKHYGLQQMSLFLKHIDLPLEQALLFWRSMFSPRCAKWAEREVAQQWHRSNLKFQPSYHTLLTQDGI